jgi:flagellar assembly protein FliH
MSHWLPKEKLTAYQRWEVAAFDEEQRAAKTSAALRRRSEAAGSGGRSRSRRAGRSVVPQADGRGHRAMPSEAHGGYAAGYAAGYAEGITAAQARRRPSRPDGPADAGVAAIDQEVADQLLALAVEIANQVLRQSLRLQPELILPVVREAVTTLHPHHGQPLLFVHPDDAAWYAASSVSNSRTATGESSKTAR